MPPIQRYGCNECDFEMPSGWGGYTYAVDDDGKRHVCPHPAEFSEVFRVTGLEYSDADAAGRVGHAQHCVCRNCVEQFDLDLQRDRLVCPKCSSPQICSLRDLVGKPCPRCRVGLIEEGSIVRWKLDADWEQLPVPQVVKDLLQYELDRKGPDSLLPAIEVANRFSSHNFFVVCCTLLGWWEGSYFSRDQDQKESAEMRRQWTWCQALPQVLAVLPALAELIVIRKGRCRFADGVTPEMRRGMKNYIRKHRVHAVWS